MPSSSSSTSASQDVYCWPYDAECALMAKLVYLNQQEQTSANPFAQKAKENVLKEHHQHWLQAGWGFIPGLEFYHDRETGYIGSAYVNHRSKQVVIAHRGTKLDNWGSLLEDYQSIFHNSVGQQMRSAFGYYRQVIAEFRGQGTDNAIAAAANFKGYQLSFTGHSLGAWIAELCALDAYLQFNMLIHTVTFDSPGSLPMMTKMLQNDPARVASIPVILDITGFYGLPNLINVINSHVGTQIQVQTTPKPCSSLEEWFFYTHREHAMTDLLESFDREQGCVQSEKAQKINGWPHHNILAERTNEYTEFHRFLKAQKTATLKTFQREFDKLYRANYRVEMYRSYEYPLRNIHPIVKDFLKGYCKVRGSLKDQIQDETLRESLDDYDFIMVGDVEFLDLGSASSISAQTLVFQMMNYISKYPDILEKLLNAHNFDARINALSTSSTNKQQTVREEFPAIMVGIGASVTNATLVVRQAVADLPEHPRPEDYQFVKNQLDRYPIQMLRMVGVAAPISGGNYVVDQAIFRVGKNNTYTHEPPKKDNEIDEAKDQEPAPQSSHEEQKTHSNAASISKMGALSETTRTGKTNTENNNAPSPESKEQRAPCCNTM